MFRVEADQIVHHAEWYVYDEIKHGRTVCHLMFEECGYARVGVRGWVRKVDNAIEVNCMACIAETACQE